MSKSVTQPQLRTTSTAGILVSSLAFVYGLICYAVFLVTFRHQESQSLS
jgi:hypothetical protein